jgi:anti-sigma factor ChrR (cupin superfamily)
MQINNDFAQRIHIQYGDLQWSASPNPMVQRKMLERDGYEVARATSIVRYEAGAKFAQHTHELGEEIFVLSGAFSDEAGHYENGTYIKNPPGSGHSPRSEHGCTLFVKLRHMNLHDAQRVVVNTNTTSWYPGLVNGLQVMPLSEFETEHTALVRWAPSTYFNAHRHFGGEEILVLEGLFEDEQGSYPAGTWLRSPHLSTHKPFSTTGCTILVKTGHLLAREPVIAWQQDQ